MILEFRLIMVIHHYTVLVKKETSILSGFSLLTTTVILQAVEHGAELHCTMLVRVENLTLSSSLWRSDPTVQNSNSNAPLHFACKKRVRFLIVDRHCDPACCGCNGRTPLHFACESEKLDIVK